MPLQEVDFLLNPDSAVIVSLPVYIVSDDRKEYLPHQIEQAFAQGRAIWESELKEERSSVCSVVMS